MQSGLARMDLKLMFNQPLFGHQRKIEFISPDQSEIVAGEEKEQHQIRVCIPNMSVLKPFRFAVFCVLGFFGFGFLPGLFGSVWR